MSHDASMLNNTLRISPIINLPLCFMICYLQLISWYFSFSIKIPLSLTDYLLKFWVSPAVNLFNQLPAAVSRLADQNCVAMTYYGF